MIHSYLLKQNQDFFLTSFFLTYCFEKVYQPQKKDFIKLKNGFTLNLPNNVNLNDTHILYIHQQSKPITDLSIDITTHYHNNNITLTLHPMHFSKFEKIVILYFLNQIYFL